MSHCVLRLKRRYDVSGKHAKCLVWSHWYLLRDRKRYKKSILYTLPRGCKVLRVVRDGVDYYPMTRPGNTSGERIVVTYLSSDMVFDYMVEKDPEWKPK